MEAKRIIFLSWIILIFISCKNENPNAFTIKGQIQGLQDGIAILMKLDLNTNERLTLDSVRISDGKFQFRGEIESPYFHSIGFNNTSERIHFFLENSQIAITGDIDQFDSLRISGSKEQDLFGQIDFDDLFDRKKGMDVMLDYPSQAFAAFTAYYQFQIHNIDKDTMKNILQSFEGNARNSIYFEHLEKLYKTLERVAIHEQAPDFSIPSVSGEPIQLSDYRGQFLLLEFWASWCAPCRASNPKLLKAYDQLKDKNFAILGISVDSKREKWLKAIEEDRLTWDQASFVKGWDELSKLYGVRAIPQNFLLDQNGVIIAKNLEPEELVSFVLEQSKL